MDFERFIGNDALKQSFLSALQAQRTVQSYLIEGSQGSGKKTFAALMAMGLLCSAPSDRRPCGVCSNCKKVQTNIHPDFFVLSPEKDKTAISVEAIRDLRESIYVLPNEGERKVYLIPEAQNLTIAAQNALLKVFEEPPPFVVIILTAVGEQGILPTILSRALRLRTAPVSREEIVHYFKDSNAKAERIACVANLSGGSIGTAKELLKSQNLDLLSSFFAEYMTALSGREMANYLACCTYFDAHKKEISNTLAFFQLWIRDILVYKVKKAKDDLYFSLFWEDIEKSASIFPKKALTRLMDITENAQEGLAANANFSSVMACMQMSSWEDTH